MTTITSDEEPQVSESRVRGTSSSASAGPARADHHRRFRGHAPLCHGNGDWRCKCGVPLNSWRYADGPEGPQVPWTGRAAARDMMRYHRADLAYPELVIRLGAGRQPGPPATATGGEIAHVAGNASASGGHRRAARQGAATRPRKPSRGR